jgi:hypothetical protein
VGGNRASRVQRPVDRIDHHAHGRVRPELDLAALLGDRHELVSFGVQPLELAERDVLGAAVDHERFVAALANALVLSSRLDPADLGEDLALALDHAPAGVDPRPRVDSLLVRHSAGECSRALVHARGLPGGYGFTRCPYPPRLRR